MRQVFQHIAGCEDHEFLLRVSYIEIYSQTTQRPAGRTEQQATADTSTIISTHAAFSSLFLSPDERVKDLLSDTTGVDLVIHESKQRGVYVNAKEVVVGSEAEVLRIMEAGEARRHYGHTEMNDLSSRSHTILRLMIESNPTSPRDSIGSANGVPATPRKTPMAKRTKPKVKVSTLNFVDLSARSADM